MFECSFITRGNPANPSLIFLHGLFGCKEDWEPILELLSSCYYCVAIDLPGHGETPYREEILKSFRTKSNAIFVGYSMGGRIALQLRDCVRGVVAIGAHLGLTTQPEKKQQHEREAVWKEKLLTLPSEEFFKEWYAQPLFESLSETPLILETLIKKRSNQDPVILSQVMSQLSLALQEKIDSFPTATLLIHGKKDSKYRELYYNIPVSVSSIENAGHTCLIENPKQCAITILNWLEKCYGNDN